MQFRGETVIKPIDPNVDVTSHEGSIHYLRFEDDDVIKVTSGLDGSVWQFSDGTTSVYQSDGAVITLRPDRSMTVSDPVDGSIEDIPAEAYDEMAIVFETCLEFALFGGIVE